MPYSLSKGTVLFHVVLLVRICFINTALCILWGKMHKLVNLQKVVLFSASQPLYAIWLWW